MKGLPAYVVKTKLDLFSFFYFLLSSLRASFTPDIPFNKLNSIDVKAMSIFDYVMQCDYFCTRKTDTL